MKNLPAISQAFGLTNLTPPSMPILPRTDFFSRTFHKWKMEDLERISEMEKNISQNYNEKVRASIDAVSQIMNAQVRLEADRAQEIDRKRRSNAEALESEAKANLKSIEELRERLNFQIEQRNYENENRKD